MKKVITSIVCILLAASALNIGAFADFNEEISAHSAIVYCANTGNVIYEKNADEQMLIASLTKIMTAIVVIENCDLDAEITPKPEWCCVEGSSMYLDYTKTYTVREILTGLMLVSGNDAATALACTLAGDERSFSAKMNEKAAELGLENTSFRNPHGLDDDEHYSSARDLAILASYCMENEEFRDIVSRYSATVGEQTYINHNKLLTRYDGCIGVKTGYTMAAGRTLVSCAERNGLRLICVTLNAPNDWEDHEKLLDHGFNEYFLTSFSDKNFKLYIDVASSALKTASAVPENEITVLTSREDKLDVMLEAPRILFAGGLKGEKVGSIRVFVNGELAAEENLVYTDDVPVDNTVRLSGIERVKRLLTLGTKPFYIS